MANVNSVDKGKSAHKKEANPLVQEALDFTKSTRIKVTTDGKPIEKGRLTLGPVPADITPGKVKTILDNLEAALAKSTNYRLDQVKQILRIKGIPLEKLVAALDGKTGDALIEAVLTLIGVDPYNYLAPEAKLAADEKTLKELEEKAAAYRQNPTEQTRAACLEAQANFTVQVPTVSTEPTLKTRYEKVKADIEKADTVLLTALEDKQKARKAETTVKTADFAALLALEEKGYVKKNERLIELIGRRLVELIKEDASAVDPERLQHLIGYVRLDYNQKLVTFKMHQGVSTYVVLIERDGSGPWQIRANKGLPGSDFYIEENNGVLTVRRTIGFPDPKFETAEINVNTASHTGDSQPISVAVTNHYPAWAKDIHKQAIDLILKLNPKILKDPKLVQLLWDAVQNEEITLEEARALGFAGKEDQLFRAIDNNMVAGQYGGDGKITISELVEAVKVMTSFADLAGISLDDAADRFNTMYLANIDYDGIRGKAEELVKAAGVLPLAAGLSDKEIGEKLKELKAKMAEGLFDLLVSRIKHGEMTSAQAVGKFATSCALASLTGHYEKLPELAALVKDGKISEFKPRKPETSAADFAEWVKEGKVKEDKETVGAGSGSDEQKDSKVNAEIEKAMTLDGLNKVVNDNRKAIEGHAKLAQIAAEKYYLFGEYGRFVEFMNLVPKEERNTSYSRKVAALVDDREGSKLHDALQESKAADIDRKGSETIRLLEQLLKAMDTESASGFNNNLYAAKYLLAETLVKHDLADRALELVKSIPVDGMFTPMDRYSKPMTITGLEAIFRIAVEANKPGAIVVPESASALDKALAKIYQAKLELQNSLTQIPPDYKNAEKAGDKFAEAVKSLPTDKKSAVETHDRLIAEIKGLIQEKGATQKIGGKLLKVLTTASKHKKGEKADGKAEKADGKTEKADKKAEKADGKPGKPGELDKELKAKLNKYVDELVKNPEAKSDAGVTVSYSTPKGGRIDKENDPELWAKAHKHVEAYLKAKHKDYQLVSSEGNDNIKQIKK